MSSPSVCGSFKLFFGSYLFNLLLLLLIFVVVLLQEKEIPASAIIVVKVLGNGKQETVL